MNLLLKITAMIAGLALMSLAGGIAFGDIQAPHWLAIASFVLVACVLVALRIGRSAIRLVSPLPRTKRATPIAAAATNSPTDGDTTSPTSSNGVSYADRN